MLTKVFTSLFPHLILSPTALHPIHPIPSRHHLNLNPQRLIPSIRRARILRSQRSNHSLSTQTRIFPRLTRRTHIRQLIANPIRDDIRVQSVLLPFRNHWIRWEESSFGGFSSGSAQLEIHCGGAGAEVGGGDGGGGVCCCGGG